MKYRHAFLQLLSLLTLSLVGWAVYRAVQQPTIGAFWGYTSGVIYEVDGGHPSANLLQVGDRVIQGNGLAPAEFYKLSGLEPGNTVAVEIERNNKQEIFSLSVANPAFRTVIERLIPILIGLTFWIVGNLVLAFSRQGLTPILFFLACQSAAISLSAGAISSYSPDWMKVLLHIGLIWAGAFVVNLHFVFPVKSIRRISRTAAYVIVGAAIVMSLIFIIGYLVSHQFLSNGIIWWVTLFILVTDLCGSIILLSQAYRKATKVKERHEAGIIILAGILGISPTVVFSIIPILIAGHPLIPPHYSLISLGLVPAGYSFAILRYRLIGVDRTINRGTAYALVMLFLGAIYVVLYSLSTRFLPALLDYSQAWVFIFAVLFAVFTNRLFHLALQFVNRVLYGGWYDYRSVVEGVSTSLIKTPRQDDEIGAVLVQTVGTAMQLDGASLILADGEMFVYTNDRTVQKHQIHMDRLRGLQEWIHTNYETSGFVPYKRAEIGWSPVDLGFSHGQPEYLVPLPGGGSNYLGFFFVGMKKDGECLDENDLDILKVVVHQAQVTLENAQLLAAAQEHSEKISRLHRQVLRAREEERKKVSRDLHDSVIQTLVGVNYHIAQFRDVVPPDKLELPNQILSQTKELVKQLRQICYDLRPPSLDSLGLFTAIHSKAEEFQEGTGLIVRVKIVGNETQEIPEEVKLCLYRFVQESLVNIQKHAGADHVEIWIQVTSEFLKVSVTDNGVGFDVPQNLDDWHQERHFGLIGLEEMVEAVNGRFEISSRPGSGCVLMAEVPL